MSSASELTKVLECLLRPVYDIHQCSLRISSFPTPTMWVKKIPPPQILLHFSPNSCKSIGQILHAYYTVLSMLDYKFLFNYLQLWWSYATLSAAI